MLFTTSGFIGVVLAAWPNPFIIAL